MWLEIYLNVAEKAAWCAFEASRREESAAMPLGLHTQKPVLPPSTSLTGSNESRE